MLPFQMLRMKNVIRRIDPYFLPRVLGGCLSGGLLFMFSPFSIFPGYGASIRSQQKTPGNASGRKVTYVFYCAAETAFMVSRIL